ncbi:MAG: hypothetical protein H0X65_14450 [Gemmatimonadetes bacterium]|nr:hypothetical protein [Gemmatimonadota bacterium]
MARRVTRIAPPTRPEGSGGQEGPQPLCSEKTQWPTGRKLSRLEEEVAAFQSMVAWEEEGRVPDGDDIMNPATVAHPAYGCRFTTADRPAMPACPRRGSD